MQITSRACPCPRVTRVGLEVLDSAMRQLLYSMCSRLWTTEVAGGGCEASTIKSFAWEPGTDCGEYSHHRGHEICLLLLPT